MKKILLFALLSVFVIASCKKKEPNPSTVVTASYPKITFSQQYYSVPVGSVRPLVQATAYDSFYKQSLRIITIDSSINTFVPGFYTGTIYAQNQYGFVTYANYYVAVTNVSDIQDLSGHWKQFTPNDSFSTNIVKLATGLYSTSNVDGVNVFTNPTGVVSDYFVAIDASDIIFANSGYIGTVIDNPAPGVDTIRYTTATGMVTFTH